MWFGWVIDIGFPGPDRGEGGKYLLIPPGYNGPLPDGGFFRGPVKDKPGALCLRGYLVKNDPKPTADLVKRTLKIYPYTPGGWGTGTPRRSKAPSNLQSIPIFPRRSSWRQAAKLSIRFRRAILPFSR